MSILVNKKTKVIIQGITGTQASFHVSRSIDYGTNIVGGVTPGRGRTVHLGVPVFDTVAEAVKATGADASVMFVPAASVKDAVSEAVDAGIKLLVCISAGVPVHDMLTIRQILKEHQTKLIGPNTPGLLVPEETRMGIYPENIHHRGRIGLISRSSTLTYEAALEINRANMGQSTVVALGDDMIIGMDFVEGLNLFHADEETDAIVMVGQIGGKFEEDAAAWYAAQKCKKPIICYIAGNDTTFRNHVGYAGDIITRGRITLTGKKKTMAQSGMIVVDNINKIHDALLSIKQ